MRHRGSVVTLCLLAALFCTAAPAPAGAKEDNYETQLREVTPSVSGLELRTEGDRSLVLENQTGKTVIVKGYDNDQFDDPYLRFRPQGLVEVNVNSTAKFLNEDPSGKAPLPSSIRPGAPPKWREVADDGTYTWFDHRIHWLEASPPGVLKDPSKETKIFDWDVPLDVGGQKGSALGTLSWVPASSASSGTSWGPILGIGAAVLALGAAAAALLLRRRRAPVAGRSGKETKEAW